MISGSAIKACFESATLGSPVRKRRYLVPDDETCEQIAESVSKEYLQIGRERAPPLLGQAQKDAESFLKHLPAARKALQKWFDIAQGIQSTIEDNPHLEGLVKMAIAEDAIRALLEKYKRKSRPYDWRDLARWISLWGLEGWKEGGTVPKGINSEGPMCRFVGEVLSRLGIHKEADNIRDALRVKAAKKGRKIEA